MDTQVFETHLFLCHFHTVNDDHLVNYESIEPEQIYTAAKWKPHPIVSELRRQKELGNQ